MIQITPHMRILVATEPVDFRKGIDGLAAICRQVLKMDPFSGTCFVFRNRAGTAVKVLIYDGQGYWLCQKRLSAGRYRWWPRQGDAGVSQLLAYELQVLLQNGNPDGCAVQPDWKRLPN